MPQYVCALRYVQIEPYVQPRAVSDLKTKIETYNTVYQKLLTLQSESCGLDAPGKSGT